MKHFKLFFALFAMLALGAGNALAEEVTINFGSGSGDVNVNDFNISTTDTYGTTWSISTVATNKSFTPNANYSQIGASSKPATSITLTGTITKACTVNSITSKWGGFSGTKGNVAITVKETSYATGTLNANTDVNVGATNDIIVAAGDKIVITVTNIAKGVKLYSLSYTYTQSTGGGETPDPTPVTVTLNKAELNLQAGATETLTATVIGSTDPVTWTSDASNIASVDNTGKVTAVAAGNATITAAIGDVKATCAVTVTAATTPEEPGTGGEETWTLVTNASDLKAGDKIVITSKDADYALSTNQKTSNRGGVTITKNGNTITISNDVQILTLEETGDAKVPFVR